MTRPVQNKIAEWSATHRASGFEQIMESVSLPNLVPSSERRGGCASRKYREASNESADGVVTPGESGLTTPSVPIDGCLRRYLLMARPPLLSQEGTTLFAYFGQLWSISADDLEVFNIFGGHTPPL